MLHVNDIVDVPEKVLILGYIQSSIFFAPEYHWCLFTHVYLIFQYYLNRLAGYVQVPTQYTNRKTSIFMYGIWTRVALLSDIAHKGIPVFSLSSSDNSASQKCWLHLYTTLFIITVYNHSYIIVCLLKHPWSISWWFP